MSILCYVNFWRLLAHTDQHSFICVQYRKLACLVSINENYLIRFKQHVANTVADGGHNKLHVASQVSLACTRTFKDIVLCIFFRLRMEQRPSDTEERCKYFEHYSRLLIQWTWTVERKGRIGMHTTFWLESPREGDH
jgi:hypothetical protein